MNDFRAVDHSAIAVSQATVIVLLVTAYIINQPLLVVLVAFFMIGGAVLGKPSFSWLYSLAFKPAGIVKPEFLPDNPEPHRFAQGFGGTVALAGFAALSGGLATLGWALSWLVAALSALNLFGGFCVGCAVYYWLHRMRVPGFSKAAPVGFVPGQRPRKSS